MVQCALAEPDGPWPLTFGIGRLENLSFFHINHVLDPNRSVKTTTTTTTTMKDKNNLRDTQESFK